MGHKNRKSKKKKSFPAHYFGDKSRNTIFKFSSRGAETLGHNGPIHLVDILMSGFLNIFSYWGQKPNPQQQLKQRSADYFLELLQRHQDLWEIANTEGTAVCCPVTASVTEKCTRKDLQMHVLLSIGSPGEFVSLIGDKVTFSGYVGILATSDTKYINSSLQILQSHVGMQG